jgi:hypothetical protein
MLFAQSLHTILVACAVLSTDDNIKDYDLYGSTSAEMHKESHVVWKWLFILKWIKFFVVIIGLY